jgi:hypothetical protein
MTDCIASLQTPAAKSLYRSIFLDDDMDRLIPPLVDDDLLNTLHQKNSLEMTLVEAGLHLQMCVLLIRIWF